MKVTWKWMAWTRKEGRTPKCTPKDPKGEVHSLHENHVRKPRAKPESTGAPTNCQPVDAATWLAPVPGLVAGEEGGWQHQQPHDS